MERLSSILPNRLRLGKGDTLSLLCTVILKLSLLHSAEPCYTPYLGGFYSAYIDDNE